MAARRQRGPYKQYLFNKDVDIPRTSLWRMNQGIYIICIYMYDIAHDIARDMLHANESEMNGTGTCNT